MSAPSVSVTTPRDTRSRFATRTARTALPALGALAAGAVLGIIAASLGWAVALFVALLPAAGMAVLRRPGLAFVVIPVLLPLGYSGVPGVGVSVADAAVLLATGTAVSAALLTGRQPLRLSPELSVAVALVCWVGFAALVAPDFVLGVKQTIVLGAGVTATMALVAVASESDMRVVLLTLLAVGGAICLEGLRSVSSLNNQFSGALVLGRASSVFAQPNDFGTFSVVILFVSVGAFLHERHRLARLVIVVIAAAASLGLVLSLSRGAWIGAVLGVMCFVVLVPSVRRYIAIGVICGVLCFGIVRLLGVASSVTEVVVERAASVLNGNKNPYDSRPAIWREARRLIAEHPLVGSGPGGFLEALNRQGTTRTAGNALHAHDVLLTVGAEAGLPAVALLIAFTVAISRRALRLARRDVASPMNGHAVGAACALVAVAGQGLVDFTLRNPMLLSTCWLLVAAILVSAEGDRRTASDRRRE